MANSSPRGWLSPKELLMRPWAIAEDQVKVAVSAGHVEVAFCLSKWPPAPVNAGAGAVTGGAHCGVPGAASESTATEDAGDHTIAA